MMRALQSTWTAALLGLFIYLGTTALLWSIVLPKLRPITPPKVPAGAWESYSLETGQLMSDLRDRLAAVKVRETELDQLATRLEAERQEIGSVTQAVTRLQQEFDAKAARLQADFNQQVTWVTAQEIPNLKRLAKTYAAMTPEAASAILKEMPDDQAVRLLSIMKDTETAPIFELWAKQNQTDTKRAALLTERLRLTVTRPETTTRRP